MRPAAKDAAHGSARAGDLAARRPLLQWAKLGAVGSGLLGSLVATLALASLDAADKGSYPPGSRRA
eukprot:10442153-Alexandrium_andersonii.AAC.1